MKNNEFFVKTMYLLCMCYIKQRFFNYKYTLLKRKKMIDL